MRDFTLFIAFFFSRLIVAASPVIMLLTLPAWPFGDDVAGGSGEDDIDWLPCPSSLSALGSTQSQDGQESVFSNELGYNLT
jgi:hypothetical protein